MHALSACTCICSKAEPHLLQTGGLQRNTVAWATALTFLCTTDTPLHECGSRHLSCKADAAACRPKIETLAQTHQHLPARQSDVARIAEQGTQGTSRPILSTKKLPDQDHACLVSMRMHVLKSRATPAPNKSPAGKHRRQGHGSDVPVHTDTPLHECWSRHLSCKDDAAACRPKTWLKITSIYQLGNQMSHT